MALEARLADANDKINSLDAFISANDSGPNPAGFATAAGMEALESMRASRDTIRDAAQRENALLQTATLERARIQGELKARLLPSEWEQKA